MLQKKIDFLRLTGLLTLIGGIIFLQTNIFSPNILPPFLRLGMPSKPSNILILGTDPLYDRETKKIVSKFGNSDTMILLYLNPIDNKISLLSIPRDTLVDIPRFGRLKINASFLIGKEKLAKKVTENLTNITIDKFLIVSTSALEEIVDLLGGVEIEVDKNMYYEDKRGHLIINLKKGPQILSGKKAHQYIRYRHDIMGDLRRIERQQLFISSLLEKIKNPFNIAKIPMLISILKKNLVTDLSLRELLTCLNFLRTINPKDFQANTLPGIPSEEPELHGAYLPNPEKIQEFLKKNFN